jgi:hypothetical protein
MDTIRQKPNLNIVCDKSTISNTIDIHKYKLLNASDLSDASDDDMYKLLNASDLSDTSDEEIKYTNVNDLSDTLDKEINQCISLPIENFDDDYFKRKMEKYKSKYYNAKNLTIKKNN